MLLGAYSNWKAPSSYPFIGIESNLFASLSYISFQIPIEKFTIKISESLTMCDLATPQLIAGVHINPSSNYLDEITSICKKSPLKIKELL